MFLRRDFLKGSLLGGFAAKINQPARPQTQAECVNVSKDIDLTPPPSSPELVYSTGLRDLDALLKGGLRRGLYLVLGPPCSGKTRLLHTIAQANLRTFTWLRPWHLLPGRKISNPIEFVQFAKDHNRSIVLVDNLLPDETYPYRRYETSAQTLCHLAMQYDLVIVASILKRNPVQPNQPLSDLDLVDCYRSVMFANGLWALNGQTLYVGKERYGLGHYGPEGGVIPWGPYPRED